MDAVSDGEVVESDEINEPNAVQPPNIENSNFAEENTAEQVNEFLLQCAENTSLNEPIVNPIENDIVSNDSRLDCVENASLDEPIVNPMEESNNFVSNDCVSDYVENASQNELVTHEKVNESDFILDCAENASLNEPTEECSNTVSNDLLFDYVENDTLNEPMEEDNNNANVISNNLLLDCVENDTLNEPIVHPMEEDNNDANDYGLQPVENTALDDPNLHQTEDINDHEDVVLPSNSASSSPKECHEIVDDADNLVINREEIKPNLPNFNEKIEYERLLIDEGNVPDSEMSATNALKNLHELISATIDEQQPNSVTTTTASFLVPLVTSTTACPNVTVVPAPLPSSLLTVPSKSATSSMENIGSKLLLLAAAQSASKSFTSPSIAASSDQSMPQLSVHPKPPQDASNSTALKGKTARLLLPKPVSTFTEQTSLISNENWSAKNLPSTVSQRPSSVESTPTVGTNVQIPNTKPTLMLNKMQSVTSTSHSHRLAKILNRTSVAPYMFEPPPPYAKFKIPPGGYRCIECGDQYGMKTCLEFHLQRRSLMIETTCIPCKQMFMFFNKCAYFAHIRMHRTKKWMTNVFRSVSVKPIVWKLMEQWFEDTAFKRFSDPDGFFEYEFGTKNNQDKPKNHEDSVVEWQNDVLSAASNGVAKMSSLGGGMYTIVAPSPSVSLRCRCSECPAELTDAQALKRHFMYNLPANQKQFICTACQAVYFSQCSFYAHKRTHSVAAPYVCPECGEVLQTSALLSTHLLSHRCKPTVLDSWRCVKCFTFYSSWEALVIHMAAAHCEMHHCCRSCTMAFSSASAFEEHKRTAHKFNIPETIEYRLLAKCCSCESLGFQGKDALIEHLKQHFATVSPFKVYRCAMCGRLMENKSGLVSHFKNVHRITVAPNGIEEDRIVIPSTDVSVTTSTNASMFPVPSTSTFPHTAPIAAPPHNSSLKYYSCKICRNLHFRSELGLKLHIKMKHSDNKSVPTVEVKSSTTVSHQPLSTSHQSTSASQQSTSSSSALSTNVPPAPIPLLSCYLCKKTFDKLESRIDDGLYHLKNGQAVCLLCQNLPMNSLSMLMRHFSKHIDEQERSGKLREGVVFVCNRHCKEEFFDRAKALNHLRLIHGQRILNCDKCRDEFVNEADLRLHQTKCRIDETKTTDERAKIAVEQQSQAVGVKRAASEVSKVAATMAKKACIIKRTISLGNSNVAAVSVPTSSATNLASYKCSKCDTKFDNREKMHQHATERHKEPKFYTCLECANNFASPMSLGRHLITSHQINDVGKYLKEFLACHPQKTNELECDVCHQIFQSKPLFISHVRTHGLLFLKTQEKRAD